MSLVSDAFVERRTGLLESSLTRRSLLKFAALSVGAAAAGTLLAACGGDDDDDDGGDPTATSSGSAGSTTATTAATEESAEPTDAATEEMAEPTEAATEEPASEETATMGAGSGAGEGAGTTHTVEATEDIVYDPSELTIKVGDTVTWVVVGSIPHTATCDPAKTSDPTHAELPEGAEPWDSGILTDGQEFSHTFDVAGEYTYFCIPHDSMTMIGKITVEA